MNINLTEEQKRFQAEIREIAEREVKPLAQYTDEKCEFPLKTLMKLGSIGLLGTEVPKEYGGNKMDGIKNAILIEELSRACSSTGAIVAVHNALGNLPILLYGTEEQKKKYLPLLASGKAIGAFALTEPEAGSDAGAIQTTANLVSGEYELNGQKRYIMNGSYAGILTVFASTDKTKGTKGISAFIVEKGMEGFEVGKKEEKMGVRGTDTPELYFKNCKVPKENLIGKEGDGFKIALSSLDYGRIGIGAQAVGIAQGALDEALEYSKKRVQFGKPISKNQAIRWFLADGAAEIEAARLLVYRAASLKDKGVRFSYEASVAKLFASEVAMRVTNTAVQIHGGRGYMKGERVERLYRDARITCIYEGTSEIQRMVIASNLLK